MAALERCRRDGVAYADHGFAAIAHAVHEGFPAHPVLGVELTGASPGCEPFLARMRETARVILVRVEAPEELCSSRMALRNAADQIPTSDDLTRRIDAASRALQWPWDALIVNDQSDPGVTATAVRRASRSWCA